MLFPIRARQNSGLSLSGLPGWRLCRSPFSMSGLEVAVDQMAAVAVAFQPIIQKCLVEIRRNDLFAKFVSLGADEREAQPGKDGDQRLRNAVGIGGAIGIFGFDLG